MGGNSRKYTKPSALFPSHRHCSSSLIVLSSSVLSLSVSQHISFSFLAWVSLTRARLASLRAKHEAEAERRDEEAVAQVLTETLSAIVDDSISQQTTTAGWFEQNGEEPGHHPFVRLFIPSVISLFVSSCVLQSIHHSCVYPA